MSTCDFYKRQATAALEERSKVIAELRSVEADSKLSDAEKRNRIEKLDKVSLCLEAEARDAVERGEREAEVRSLGNKSGLGAVLVGAREDESDAFRALLPSLSEYRLLQESVPGDGGYTVPQDTAAKYVDVLKARSVFLKGLPAESIIPFNSAQFTLPQLVSSTDAGYAAEGAVIGEGDMTFAGLSFQSKKIAEMRYASNELLVDTAIDMRNLIGNDMLRSASVRLDADAFNGTGANPIQGIISQGTTTTLGAGDFAASYDDLADAVARIEAANGVASVVWASPDVAAALRKEKATTSGVYQGGAPTESPANTAWGLPVLSSASLPAKTAIVADGTRIFFGLRQAAEVRLSDQMRFDQDQTAFRLTMRVAGIRVAEASSVQIVKGAAS
jgi:HK97 family phage major capsid protein